MLINSVESLVRNGYQIHVTTSGEVYVYFSTDSQARQHEVWDRDKALIDAFLGGRYISDYCYMSIRPVAAFFSEPVAEPAPVPTPKSTASKSAHKPVVAESVAESVVDSTPHVPNTPAFKPELETLPERPKEMRVRKGSMYKTDYIIYTKQDGNLHLHWKVSRNEAKKVWRESREVIQNWLNGRVLNTVSWEESSAKADKATKWKEISAEQTKVRTVVRQLVAFGKPVADLAQLSDGSYHVYFHLPKEEAKQIYSNIKAEFADYEAVIASVSFEF
jgi:hypothetical protein